MPLPALVISWCVLFRRVRVSGWTKPSTFKKPMRDVKGIECRDNAESVPIRSSSLFDGMVGWHGCWGRSRQSCDDHVRGSLKKTSVCARLFPGVHGLCVTWHVIKRMRFHTDKGMLLVIRLREVLAFPCSFWLWWRRWFGLSSPRQHLPAEPAREHHISTSIDASSWELQAAAERMFLRHVLHTQCC